MMYAVQFVRFRRGIREPIRTVPCEALDAQTALHEGKRYRGPPQADGIRVLHERGSCVGQWRVGDG
jgi:hypothetical protein